NGDIEIDPAGIGDVYIHSDDVYLKPAGLTTQSQLNFWELGTGNTHYTGLKSQATLAANLAVTLPTESGTLLTSTQITAEAHHLTNANANAGDAEGTKVFFGGTINMTAGKIYAFTTGGVWAAASAASANLSSTGLLAVACGAASDTNGMLIQGTVKLDHDPGAIADLLYLKNDGSGASATAPSTAGNVVRQLGYCLHSTSQNIYFNPSTDYIVVA
ncbi:MAG: hypothetical protein P8N43_08755, partial [Alphaproteobacteria bacterium]|nr:hypothetical protein [Alphaproteobacteria bacterium]